MSLQHYLTVQERPSTQYQLKPKFEWRMLQNCSNFPNRKIRIYGYVFHATNGQNRGQTLKILWFLSNKFFSDIHLLASCGRESLRKFYWDLEVRIAKEGTEKLPYSENLSISSWSYDMEGHGKKCVERYCELANNNPTMHLLLASMTTTSKKKK